jgi:hypothetical protein
MEKRHEGRDCQDRASATKAAAIAWALNFPPAQMLGACIFLFFYFTFI